NYTNIAAAACVGSYFEIKTLDIKDAISNYIPSNNRSQIIEKGDVKIILDAYNANPSSVQAAVNNFAQQPQENKTVILGDMLELGTEAATEHQNIVDQLMEHGFEKVYLIGQNFYNTDNDYFKFKNFEEFKEVFSNTRKGKHPELYLIKGSRGMALERTLELF